MKTTIIAASAILLASGSAMAAQPSYGWRHGGLTPYERAVIARSRANLNALKHQAWADGRLGFFERVRIRIAEQRHAQLVRKERRD